MKKKIVDPLLLSRQNYQIVKDAELTNEQIGQFVLALLTYQVEGTLPEDMDPEALTVWKVIHADMKRQFGEGIR